MAADIAPELLEQIKKAAARLENQNALVQAFREKSENKTAKLEDVHGYALGLGESASAALLDVIKSGVLPDDKFYFNIANRTVRPLLADDISAIQDAAAEVQKIIDEENGIGLNSVRADFPESRVAGIIDKLDKSESLDEIRKYLGEPIVNLLESSFDGWVQANAESRYQTGLSAIVIRIAHGGACAWCKNLAGTYDYESVRYGSDVWRRHRYCRCVVTYENGKIRQSAWSRKIWRSSPEELERRRNAGNTLFRMTPDMLNEINAEITERVKRDREAARLMRENPGLTRDRARYYENRIANPAERGKIKVLIGSETSNGIRIQQVSAHSIDRSGERSVSSENVLDAIRNPLHIGEVKTDDQGRRSQRFIGRDATVNVNPDNGVITTVWKTGTRERKKYSGSD